MIKKWVIGAVAYLLVVMAGYEIHNSTVEPEPAEQHHEGVNHDH